MVVGKELASVRSSHGENDHGPPLSLTRIYNTNTVDIEKFRSCDIIEVEQTLVRLVVSDLVDVHSDGSLVLANRHQTTGRGGWKMSSNAT